MEFEVAKEILYGYLLRKSSEIIEKVGMSQKEIDALNTIITNWGNTIETIEVVELSET